MRHMNRKQRTPLGPPSVGAREGGMRRGTGWWQLEVVGAPFGIATGFTQGGSFRPTLG